MTTHYQGDTLSHAPTCEAADVAASRTAECACPTAPDDDATEQWQAAYDAGRQAFRDYVRYTQNPYRDSDMRERWGEGWLEAEGEAHG